MEQQELVAEDPYILPIVEPDELNGEIEFQKALEAAQANDKARLISMYFSGEIDVPDSIDKENLILLKLLMDGSLGTPSQRGSITRILNTLAENIFNPNPEIVVGLGRVLREKRLLD